MIYLVAFLNVINRSSITIHLTVIINNGTARVNSVPTTLGITLMFIFLRIFRAEYCVPAVALTCSRFVNQVIL